MKKKLSLLLAAAMLVSVMAGCGTKSNGSDSSGPVSSSVSDGSDVSSVDDSQSGSELAEINFMVLSGPTGVGAAQVISAHDAGEDGEDYAPAGFILHTEVVADNTEVNNALINGTADIAAIATNVAATLSAKSDGAIQVLAVNTLGVLYILEKGDTVNSMADLNGKTLYAPSTGKGANPEYVLNYLLTENGVDPTEVDIQWLTPQEITAQMISSEEGVCMLPVPAATALLVQDSEVREAVSLSDEWDKLDQGALAMGCVVARTEFVEENPEAVEAFLDAYQASIEYMNDEANREEASELVAQYEITPSAAIAAKAIPQCNLVYLAGVEMKEVLEQYYQVLFQADPTSIGGAMPYDSFYYGVE